MRKTGILLALALCVALLLTVGFAEEKSYTEEYFQTQAEPREGVAWLELSPETFTQENDGKTYNMYIMHINEVGGVGFSIQELTSCAFGNAGTRSQTFTGEDLKGFGLEPDLEPNGTFQIMGGFPAEDYDRFGMEVVGVDANGEALTFVAWVNYGA